MTKQVLIRNLPDDLGQWIETERKRGNVTQREFISSILTKAYESSLSTQSALFPPQRLVPLPLGPRTFKFIDLFGGIGGFRIALEHLGGECVFTSEWDKFSQKTYHAWFGEMPAGDIRKIKPELIPQHDILAAGFPCQPFSIAGVSKKKSLGRAHGFADEKQGNLFFYLADIIEKKRPSVLFLENVKNLRTHDQGRTWQVIKTTLEDLDYAVFDKIYDAAKLVPQHRERVFIVGFDKRLYGATPEFAFPELTDARPKLHTILEKVPHPRYTLTKNLWKYLQNYARRHQEMGHGFGFGIADPDGVTRTLSARYYKDGSEILIKQKKGSPPRRLTPSECARLMGFPEECRIVVSDTQAYRQFGNAVVVPVVKHVGKAVVATLLAKKKTTRYK